MTILQLCYKVLITLHLKRSWLFLSYISQKDEDRYVYYLLYAVKLEVVRSQNVIADNFWFHYTKKRGFILHLVSDKFIKLFNVCTVFFY